MHILDIKITENYHETIEKIIKDSSYTSIKRYLNLLPKEYETDESLYYYGMSYINKLYKEMAILEDQKSKEGIELNKILEKQQIVYFAYTYVNYKNTHLNFDEFITFSKLITFAFHEYNPNIIRESDNNPYRCNNKEIEDIVNSVIRNNQHQEHKNAFEIDRTKLEILLTILNNKCQTLMAKNLNELKLEKHSNYLDEIITTPQALERIKCYIKKNKSGK